MKVDIVSGFLGAGKTTIIKKLINSNLKKEKLAIIENEFGEVSIDGDILKDTNIDMKEINSGCICCSLEGDFKKAILEIRKLYKPDRLIIEPSGVAKLTDIIKSLKEIDNIEVNNIFTVVDIDNYDNYLNNFGEFYKDQIRNAKVIIASKRGGNEDKLIDNIVNSLRTLNKNSSIVTAKVDMIDGNDLISIAGKSKTIEEKKVKFKLSKGKGIAKRSNKAENVFSTWGMETNKKFTEFKIKKIFEEISKDSDYGNVLRGKGILSLEDNKWAEFHYTQGRFQIKLTRANGVGKVAIIGEGINKEKLNLIFNK